MNREPFSYSSNSYSNNNNYRSDYNQRPNSYYSNDHSNRYDRYDKNRDRSKEERRSPTFERYNSPKRNSSGKRDFLQFNSNAREDKDLNEDEYGHEDSYKQVKTENRSRNDYGDSRGKGNLGPIQNFEEEKLAPWMSQSTQKIKNTLVRFHNEINEFVNFVTPTKEDHTKREQAMERLTAVIMGIVPSAKLIPFGSFATNLYLPHGDIDLVVMEPNINAVTLMNKIAKALMRNTDYDSINVIRSAKVPLIKLIEKSSNFNFDLSFNKLDGVKQLKEIQKSLQYYPEMKHLLLVIKCFLKQRDLNETYTGGIGSFLLFCLILTYLRETRREFIESGLEEEIPKILLSEHILKFFDFYANFDVANKQIIIGEGGAIVNKYEKEPSLSVVSPQDATHDIGGASFKAKEVFGIFKNRYHFITNYNFGDKESILKYLIKAELL